MRNILCILLLLLSISTYCANIEIHINNKKNLAQSLYGNEADLSFLSYEATILHIQTLKERIAVLKQVFAAETGFFHNFDIVKGIVGTYFGLQWSIQSIFFFCVFLYDASLNSQPSKESISHHRIILTIPSAAFAIFSLWLLKKSVTCLHRGWYKKKNTLKELAQIKESLKQYQEYSNLRFNLKNNSFN